MLPKTLPTSPSSPIFPSVCSIPSYFSNQCIKSIINSHSGFS